MNNIKIMTLLFFFISLNTFSQGKVLFVKKKVFANKKILKRGDRIATGTVITSGKGAIAVIKFDNSSTVKINENSSVVLKKYDKVKKSTRFSLIKGSGFFQMDPKAGGKLSVQARTVAMGIRGTHFFVSYGKKKKEDVYMCVQKGKVAIRGKKQGKPVLVKAGQGVVVADGLKSSKPSYLPWTKDLNWELDPEKKDLENKISIEEGYSNPLDRDYD